LYNTQLKSDFILYINCVNFLGIL